MALSKTRCSIINAWFLLRVRLELDSFEIQEAYGPHTRLTWENFLKIDKHAWSLLWWLREKKPLFTLWELNGSSFDQTWIPFTQRCNVAGCWNWSSGSWQADFKMLLFAISKLFPLENDRPLHLNIEHFFNLGPIHRRMHCAKFAWNWSGGSWDEDF